MFRLFRALVLLFVALIAAAAVAVFYAEHTRLDARSQPGRLETEIALRLRSFAIPAEQRNRTNPVRSTPEAVRAGMEHFADHCAICHANDGTGDTAFGRGLYPKPPDLRSSRTQALPDGEIFAIIENGVRFTGMPGFGAGGEHSDEDTWKLVLFIRHLPSITPDELTRMKALNPRGPDERQEEQDIEDFLKGGAPAAKPHTHGEKR